MPVWSARAQETVHPGLRASKLLAGVRGARPAGLDAVTRAITGVSGLAAGLGGTSRRSTPTAYLRAGPGRRGRRAGSSAPNDPCGQLIAPAGSSA
jgi:hypothetical protein